MRADSVRDVSSRHECRGPAGSLSRLLDDMGADPLAMSEDDFYALAMLVVDAALAGDAPVLEDALRGLQRLSGALVRAGAGQVEAAERLGRLRALVDCTSWAVARAAPGPARDLSRVVGPDLDEPGFGAVDRRLGEARLVR